MARERGTAAAGTPSRDGRRRRPRGDVLQREALENPRHGVAAARRRFGIPDAALVTPARFERATCRLGGDRSIQLSYGAMLSKLG